MLLRDDLRYVVLDFETTWTDKKYDEIIQIWVTEYGVDGNVIQEFCSYIKPQHTEKLQDIIGMITGISQEDILHAPTREEIKPSVSPYFDEKTVIIWHSVGFDIAFLERYGIDTYYTSIDTLGLSQALIPYLPSYALEIIATHLLGAKVSENEWFHDAGVDSKITGKVFFELLRILQSVLYEFPYLREISKRADDGLPLCIAYDPTNRYLLKDIPQFSTSPQRDYPEKANNLPEWSWYIGWIHIDALADLTTQSNMISAFWQHQKALLVQKRLAQNGNMLQLHEQHSFDADTLHHFLTKKTYQERERRCAIKYHLHIMQKHKSYHCVNHHDYLFAKAMYASVTRTPNKKLYTHGEIFSHIENLSLPSNSHIIVYDKEWIFDSWKRRRFNAVDLYQTADILEATIYKYMLHSKKTTLLEQLLSTRYIFTALLTAEGDAHCKDFNVDHVTVDNFSRSIYFYKSRYCLQNILSLLNTIYTQVDNNDLVTIETAIKSIEKTLTNPFTITIRRWNYAQRCTLQKVDTYVTRDDINQFFQWFHITYLSAIDTKLPPLPVEWLPAVENKNVVKWKEIKVWDTPKICIIAPSKAAAQQLLMSLHKSAAYKDCFLAAEHVTWWAGKIIQQTLQKKSYMLVGWYGFCLQCIAHGLQFDSISALDIIQSWALNPFMDISYYAATKKI